MTLLGKDSEEMKRPLLLPVVCYASGIVVGWDASLSLSAIWTFTLLNLGAATLATRQRGALLLVLCVSFGWLQIALHRTPYSPQDLRLQVGDHPILTVLEGRIERAPRLSSPQLTSTQPVRWSVPLEVISMGTLGGRPAQQTAQGRVIIFSEGAFHTNLTTGARIRVQGVLSRPAPAKAPGIFDYREKLRREGIHYQLKTAAASDWQLLDPPRRKPLQDRFRHWAREQFAAGLPGEDESLRLLWAMVLGWRTALTDEVAEPFMRSGTMHIFAISGLHIALISGILIALLRVLRLGQAWCGAIVIPLLWFYCAATGFQASATRATIMMSIIITGWALRRPTDLLNSTCAAAFMILLWDPLQLLQAGFQLSFSVVLTIALLYPRFSDWGKQNIQLDPLRPEADTPRGLKATVWFGRQAYSLLAISFTAWIGSMPLIAYYFNLWTPGALVANPIVVLLATAAIASAIGGLATSLICPPLGELFNHSAWLWVRCQAGLSEWTSQLPGCWWRVPEANLLDVTIGYLLIIGWGNHWFRKNRRLAGAYGLIVIALTIFEFTQRFQQSTRTQLTVFGHNANAIYCDRPGVRHDLLIDCGREDSFDAVIAPYLHRRGTDHIANFLLTHGDINHVESFELAAATFTPVRVAVSPVRQRSPVYQTILRQLDGPEQSRFNKLTIRAGDQLADWQVIHPRLQTGFHRADDAAVALYSRIHGWGVLILSDPSLLTQAHLLTRNPELDADILILGISDPETLATEELLDAVSPRLVVVQDNRHPVQDRLDTAASSQIRRRGIQLLRVSHAGSIAIQLDRARITLQTVGKSPTPIRR